MGGTFLVGAALLGTMYTAALPLFDLMWKEGALFDKAFAFILVLPILLYPLIALGCFMYQEVIKIDKSGSDFEVESFEKLGPIKWKHHKVKNVKIEDFKIENWKGALNQAALVAAQKGTEDRYATRGHWMLKIRKGGAEKEIILERRAKQEEIEDLRSSIESFSRSST